MTADASMSSEQLSISQHPDIQELTHRYSGATAAERATACLPGLMVLAGVYAAVSPWIVGFEGRSAFATTDLVVGLVIAYLAYTMVRQSSQFLAAVSALMGVWLIVAPWAVQHTDRTAGLLTSNILVGAAVVLLGTATAALAFPRHAR